jgi:hypothetical protein
MTTIKLKCAHDGWQVTFRGHDRMPDNVPVPLPYTPAVPLTDVLEMLQAAFPHALYHWDCKCAGPLMGAHVVTKMTGA